MEKFKSIQFGEITIKIISNSENLTVAEIFFPSNSVSVAHKHKNEEINYVVKGTFETIYNNKKIILNPGDTFSVTADEEHSLSCISNENGLIITSWYPSRKDLISKAL